MNKSLLKYKLIFSKKIDMLFKTHLAKAIKYSFKFVAAYLVQV